MILLQKTRRAEAVKKQKRLDRLTWWFRTCTMWLVIVIVLFVVFVVLFWIEFR